MSAEGSAAAWEYLVLLTHLFSDHYVHGQHLLLSSELCQVPAWDQGEPRSLGRGECVPAWPILLGWIPPQGCAPGPPLGIQRSLLCLLGIG